MLAAEVFVDTQALNIDIPFTYIVPESLKQEAAVGKRAVVPFGAGNKKLQCLITKVFEIENLPRQLKQVWAILDEEPVLDAQQLEILDYLVTHTFCTHYEALRTILPVGINIVTKKEYCINPKADFDYEKLAEQERMLVDFLRKAKAATEINSFLGYKGNPEKQKSIMSLMNKGIVIYSESIKRKAPQKKLRMVRALTVKELPQLSKKQQEVYTLLSEVCTAVPKEICELCGVTEAVLRGIVKKGLAEYYDKLLDPEALPKSDDIIPADVSDNIALSAEQKQVYEGILKLCGDKPSAALLHGITGSGKTQVYFKLIAQMLARGKNAVMLVPEISLTPQLTQEMKRLFGENIAVMHSGLSVAKRFEEYNHIKSGGVKIVVGTRSAIFAPLKNIGIVIMDEEAEGSYKSETSPRYHARDIAKLVCRQNNALLLLGSATPSVESYYNAQNGKYSLFKLTRRYANAKLPQVLVVDMRKELQEKKNFSPLSIAMQNAIKTTIARGEQVILLINRRGYNSVATCLDCGEIIKCPYCDVAMTYHRFNNSLMCHYCGHREDFVSLCKHCGSEYIKLSGIGTQRLENELNTLFEDARVLRMDADTTYANNAYEKAFSAFEKGDYDILIGTQMIAKGLNFPNVTLVGVLNADSGLYSPDFYSSERTFSLITQVVGRSGRSEKEGSAIIQTLEPENPIIAYAAEQNYEGFFKDEISTRKMLFIPPFCDMLAITVSGENEKNVKNAAYTALNKLKEHTLNKQGIAIKVLGVSEAQIYKMNNKYRWRIVVKSRMNNPLRRILTEYQRDCLSDKRFSGVSVFIDINGNFAI